MAIEVNGVTLPDIPEDGLQYAVIVKMVDSGDITYGLITSVNPTVYLPQDVLGLPINAVCANPALGDSGIVYQLVGDEWDGVDTSEIMMPEMAGQYDVIWSNHDIYIATSVTNTESFEFAVSDELFFARNDNPFVYEPEYGVPTEHLLSLAEDIRRLSGIKNKLSTEQMVEILSAVKNAPDVEGVWF